MSDPITTEDLYGTSKEEKIAKIAASLPIEETPEILPITDSGEPQTSDTPSVTPAQPVIPMPNQPPVVPHQAEPTKKGSGCLHTISIVIIFAALFVAGIWLSSFIRQFVPSASDTSTQSVTPTPPEIPESTPSGSTARPRTDSTWKTYDVISGTTKIPVPGVKFQLPENILKPICDGSACASQGTYLPGGTRFTVAARGTGQMLADYRGNGISDVGGITFATKPMTVLGHQALEFTGSFTGTTTSGYAFAKMRGVMIALTDTTSLEVNHFVPSGITADFESDDVLFDRIVQSVTFPGVSQKNPGSPSPSSVTATSSGY